MASTTIPALRGQRIHDCSIWVDDNTDTSISQTFRHSSALPLPVTFRIFFDPTKRLAFFRFHTTVELITNAQACSASFFLDIFPENVRTLSLHRHNHNRGPPTREPQPTSQCLHFRFGAPGSFRLVAPQEVPSGQLHPATPAARATFYSLRFIALQTAICVLLPPAADDLPLDTCCHAISTQELFVAPLRPDPGLVSLRSLYSGKGGRVVDIDRELATPALPGTTSPSPSDCPPPAYDQTAAPSSVSSSLLHTTAPGASKGKKRLRSRSPQSPGSDSSSPRYRTWDHFNLAVGEREKMMAELLRRADKRETALNRLINEANETACHLRALVGVAKERETALEDHVSVADKDRAAPHQPAELQVQVDAATPRAPSTQGSSSSTASTVSNISDRVQAHLNLRLEQLSKEIRDQGYLTANDMDDALYEGGYVKEDAMVEAIEEAVDRAMDQVRDRILDAFL